LVKKSCKLIAIEVCRQKSKEWRNQKLKKVALIYDKCEAAVASVKRWQDRKGICKKTIVDGPITFVEDYKVGTSILGLTFHSNRKNYKFGETNHEKRHMRKKLTHVNGDVEKVKF